MTYIAYLDEFGHVGPYVSRADARHNDSPVFGLAGFIMPVEQRTSPLPRSHRWAAMVVEPTSIARP